MPLRWQSAFLGDAVDIFGNLYCVGRRQVLFCKALRVC
jgi:hypothetical protein